MSRPLLDPEHIGRHLRQLAPHVRGILVPGSTGEGWEMGDADILELLGVVLEVIRDLDMKALIGVLKTEAAAMEDRLDATAAWLVQRTRASTTEEALAQSGVVGFTVCPPAGSDLSQEAIGAALSRILARGWPTALYQLPQVTHNEMSPDTVGRLAAEYPNFYLFKDTSGQDRVARSEVDLGGVFLVRGAEGDYAKWLKPAGGPYDGFLLSTANTLAGPLHEILRLADAGELAQAEDLSQRVGHVVEECFRAAGAFPTGNPFTNTNKALDHVLTRGAAALEEEPPLLHSGVRLPRRLIEQVVAILHHAGFA